MRRIVLTASASMVALGAAIYEGYAYGAYMILGVWAVVMIKVVRKAGKGKERALCEIRKIRKEQEKERVKARKEVQDANLRAAHEKEIREAREEDLAAARELIERYREERQRMIAEGPRVVFQKDTDSDNWKDPDDIYRGAFKSL